jgi:hypothetical protein
MLDPEILRSLLEHEDGRLVWRPRDREWFSDERSFRTWNSRFAGREAFTAKHSAGYRVGCIDGRTYFAHRVIWVMHCGPADGEIDHINGNRADNRLENLRLVTREENRRNVKRQANNKSGATGIRQQGNSWEALIQVGGKQTYLGRFPTFAEALQARKNAEADMNFHANHGRG